MTAPIALFCFRRPDHLRATLAALAANHGAGDHDVVAFADGPRDGRDAPGVAAVGAVLAEWRGRGAFRSFVIDAQAANLGLRRSVVRGVGQLVGEAGTVIVIEDDLVTSPFFLQYCGDGLRTYAREERVASIHGYSYPVVDPLPETFFLRGADCWGWATWRRAWRMYDDDATALLTRIETQGLAQKFDYGGVMNFRQMLSDAQAGKVDSWAIRWHASAFLAEMHTLYPGRSLVRNIGLDASGTHCNGGDGLDGSLSSGAVVVEQQEVRENGQAWVAFAKHFRSMRPSVWTRLRNNLSSLLDGDR